MNIQVQRTRVNKYSFLFFKKGNIGNFKAWTQKEESGKCSFKHEHDYHILQKGTLECQLIWGE